MEYTVHGILQARILELVAVPSPEDLPNSGIESRSPALQVDSLPAEATRVAPLTLEACAVLIRIIIANVF